MKNSGTQNPFEELRKALLRIEAEGVKEEETEEDRLLMEVLRASEALEGGFGSLTDDEIDAIGRALGEETLDVRRLRAAISRRLGAAQRLHTAASGKMIAAAIYRREGEGDSHERARVQAELDRIRRELDRDRN